LNLQKSEAMILRSLILSYGSSGIFPFLIHVEAQQLGMHFF
jgi:hypothetical protein